MPSELHVFRGATSCDACGMTLRKPQPLEKGPKLLFCLKAGRQRGIELCDACLVRTAELLASAARLLREKAAGDGFSLSRDE